MKSLEKAAESIDRYLVTLARYTAALLLIINILIIADTYFAGRSAFVSDDLLLYKPGPELAADGVNGFSDLLKLNEDAVGWLTVYGTHIDYPLVQGRDNFEYSNKDIYGQSSLSGAIYLDYGANAFHDWASILYGHHMENGGMFGDIDKYDSDEFLKEHRNGYLQTPEGNYRLTIFACVLTDAYEDQIYHYTESESDAPQQIRKKRAELAAYIKKHALCRYGDYLDQNLMNVNKLIIMSTCESEDTFGRLVLLADAVPGTGRPESSTDASKGSAPGHSRGKKSWSVLNLLCLVSVLFSLADSIKMHKKCRRIELLLTAAALVLFALTQNVFGQIKVSDRYTALMFVIMIIAFIVTLKLVERSSGK